MAFAAQGVVAEATLLLDRLKDVVKEFHRHGLYLFTWGDVNNTLDNYVAQRAYGLDGIILDDVARVAKVSARPAGCSSCVAAAAEEAAVRAPAAGQREALFPVQQAHQLACQLRGCVQC